jgi:hypothetical protein
MYGEAVVSANKLGQDVFTWMNDAIAAHVYRVELLQVQEAYRADLQAFNAGETHVSPQSYDPKYQVTRPKPEITPPPAGKGSGPTGSSYRA